MAKNNKRPKWLDAETPELLNTLKEILGAEELDEKDQTKAMKIAEELIARIPSQDDAPVSVPESLEKAKEMIDAAMSMVQAAYDHEVSVIAETEADAPAEDDTTEDEDEAPAPKKSKKDKKEKKAKKEKKSKKAAKVEEPDEDDSDDEEAEAEAEDDEDPNGEDYSDWSLKDLKKECRERGIKVTKAMGKAEMVKALEADDKE